MSTPYTGKDVSEWNNITVELIARHPITTDEIVETVLNSWTDIFNSKIGSFSIGKEIRPNPQIISFLLHELVAHYLSLKHPNEYRVGIEKGEKDIHCIGNSSFSIEIKASSHPSQIFANRSYAQPESGNGQKDKNGYYIVINFEKFEEGESKLPEISLIRFGYLEHSDWTAQSSATGQQARLSTDAYKYKLKQIYPKIKTEQET